MKRRHETNSISPIQIRDFYRASASFFRQSPWRVGGEDEPIQVECEPLQGGPRFALVLGNKGKVKGLWLGDDWTTCVLFVKGDYNTVAEHLRYTILYFGDQSEIDPHDQEQVQDHGFELAGPDAFPVVFCKEPGQDFRKPDAGELERLEACLWVLPDFLKRAEDRGPDVYEYAFKGVQGKRSLDLSWVPRERLNEGWQERPF